VRPGKPLQVLFISKSTVILERHEIAKDSLCRVCDDISTGNTTLYSTKRSPNEDCPNFGIPFPLIVCTKPTGWLDDTLVKYEGRSAHLVELRPFSRVVKSVRQGG